MPGYDPGGTATPEIVLISYTFLIGVANSVNSDLYSTMRLLEGNILMRPNYLKAQSVIGFLAQIRLGDFRQLFYRFRVAQG